MYADTVVLEDQIVNQLMSFRNGSRTGVRIDFHYIIDYAIEYFTLEHLFTSDSGTPICELAPASLWSLDQNNLRDTAWNLTCEATTAYASELFGKTFSSIDELRKLLSEIKDDNQFFSLIGKTQKLVSQDGVKISPEYLQRFRRISKLRVPEELDSLYEAVLHTQNSVRVNDLIYNGLPRSIPVTNYRAVLNSITWLMKHDNEKVFANLQKKIFSKGALIISSLQQEDLKWLGNVPINKIRELREKGELADLRDFIGRDIENIVNASDEDFIEVGNQVKYNIDNALKKHDAQIKDLNEKYRRSYHLDIAQIAVSGTIGFVSAAFQPFASATGILSTISIVSPSVIGTVRDYLNKRNEFKDLKRKPVAILFDAKRVQQD